MEEWLSKTEEDGTIKTDRYAVKSELFIQSQLSGSPDYLHDQDGLLKTENKGLLWSCYFLIPGST